MGYKGKHTKRAVSLTKKAEAKKTGSKVPAIGEGMKPNHGARIQTLDDLQRAFRPQVPAGVVYESVCAHHS